MATATRSTALLLALLALAAAQGPIKSAVFGPALQKEVLERGKDALSASTTAASVFYGAKLVEALGNGVAPKCNCGKIASLLSSAPSVHDIYYGVAAAKVCKCTDVKISDKQKQQIRQELQSSEIGPLAAAVLASKAAGLTEGEQALDKLISLQTPDGLFKTSVGAPGKGSLANAKLALQALASYSDRDDVGKALDKALELLPSGESEGDSTAVDPLLVVYLKGKADKKLKSKPKQALGVAAALLPLQYDRDLQTLSLFVDALQIVKAYSSAPLYHVAALDKTVRAGGDGAVGFAVTDLFGNKVTPESVEVKSVKRQGADKPLSLSGSAASLATPSAVNLSPLGEAAQQSGRYTVELSVTVAGLSKPLLAFLRFVVPRSFEVSKVHAGVSSTKQVSVSELAPVATQNKWNGGAASAETGDFVHVAFTLQQQQKTSGSSFQKPQQCFAKFTHVASGVDSIFVVSPETGAEARYKLSVALAKEVETFNHQSGDYLVSLLVADVASAAPIEFVIGSVAIAVPAKTEKIAPLYTTSLLHTSDNTLVPLPEFDHVMRPPAKRASVGMATIFTALAIAPLVVFVLYALSQLTASSLASLFTSVSTLLFLGCIGGSLLLFLAYWLGLPAFSFYESIRYICIALPVTAVIARAAINSKAQ